MRKKQKPNLYLQLFLRQADLAVRIARETQWTAGQEDPLALSQLQESVQACRKSGRSLALQVQKQVDKEFLPPLNREDLLQMNQKLEEATQAQAYVVDCIYQMHFSAMKPEAKKLLRLCAEQCNLMLQTVKAFAGYRQPNWIGEIQKQSETVRQQSWRAWQAACRELNVKTLDARELFRWTRLFDAIYAAQAAAESAIKSMEYAAIKNK